MPKVEIRRRDIPALGKGYVIWNLDDDEPAYRNPYLSIPEAVGDVNKANAAKVTSMLPGMALPEDLCIVATCEPWPLEDEDELDVYGINRQLEAHNETAAKAFVEEVEKIIEEMRAESAA